MAGINIQPWDLLGLHASATPEEIHRARGELAKILHPDVRNGQNTAIMQLINHAVEVMLARQSGHYAFTGGLTREEQARNERAREESARNQQAREERAREEQAQNEHAGGRPGGREHQGRRPACNHPRKPGYRQCFECSGVRLCELCGIGYYGPPNDRCRACRQRRAGL